MINSNLGSILHRFQDMVTYNLKHSISWCVMTLQGHPGLMIYTLFESQ